MSELWAKASRRGDGQRTSLVLGSRPAADRDPRCQPHPLPNRDRTFVDRDGVGVPRQVAK